MKFIILFDSGNTNNFIHSCIAEKINFYISAVKKFQIIIVNGGSMKCGGSCENGYVKICKYHLKYQIFSIEMGGHNIVLCFQWLCPLGPIIVQFVS
jgi:hypothetical protein